MKLAEAINESWRPIVGYEGLYEVSDRGGVRVATSKVLKKPTPNPPTNHLRVNLHRQGKSVSHYVHRLVALAFIGPEPDGLEVRHRDGDNQNNTVGNLRYGTRSENQLDRVRHGRHFQAEKTECPRGHRLGGFNNKPQKARNHRECYACSRAHGYFGWHGKPSSAEEFKAVADRYYREIMGVSV